MRFHAGFTWLCELYGASLTWRALRGDASDRCYAGAQSSPVSRHCSARQPARCFCFLLKSLAGAAFCHPTVVCGQQISLRLKTSNYRFPQIVPSWHSGACCHPVPVEIRLFVSLYPTRIGITGFHPNRPQTKRGAAVWPRPLIQPRSRGLVNSFEEGLPSHLDIEAIAGPVVNRQIAAIAARVVLGHHVVSIVPQPVIVRQ